MPELRQAHTFQQLIDTVLEITRFHIQQLTMQIEKLPSGQPLLKPKMFRQKADTSQRCPITEGRAQQHAISRSWVDQPQQHLDRGGFSGTVRAKKAKDLALLHLQGESFDSGIFAKYFA